MDMEKQDWIENILNSINGTTAVSPGDDLFSKIQRRIQQQDTVSSKTLWLVAASIAVLVLLNISVISSKSRSKSDSTNHYLELTVNQNNQLYQ